MIRKLITLAVAILILTGCQKEEKASEVSGIKKDNPHNALAQKWLAEIDESFTHQGERLHPKLFKMLGPWLSDSGRGVIHSLDITSQLELNNQFHDDIKERGRYLQSDNEENRSYCLYRYAGKLANGYHVVDFAENGGGSGTWDEVFVLKFSVIEAYDYDGKSPRLIATLVRNIYLGDRSGRELTIKGNEIHFSASSRYSDSEPYFIKID